MQGKSMCIDGRLVQNVPQGINTRSTRSACSSLSVANMETERPPDVYVKTVLTFRDKPAPA